MLLNNTYKTNKLYKIYQGVGDTQTNREFYEETIKSGITLSPTDILTYYDYIPNGSEISGGQEALDRVRALNAENNKIQHVVDEVTTICVLEKYFLQPLVKVENTKKSWQLVDKLNRPLTNIIPTNYYKDYYIQRLYTSEGIEIPIGLSNWTVDPYTGILTFYDELPEGVDDLHPPMMTFCCYKGGNGFKKESIGFEGTLIPIENFTIPSNTFSTTGTTKNLLSEIINTANQLADNFLENYGWDGADNNEGIALGYNIVSSLKYASSKDPVMGYGDSIDSEVSALISRKLNSNTNTYKILTNYTESEMPTEMVFPWVQLDIKNLNITVNAQEEGEWYLLQDLEDVVASLNRDRIYSVLNVVLSNDFNRDATNAWGNALKALNNFKGEIILNINSSNLTSTIDDTINSTEINLSFLQNLREFNKFNNLVKGIIIKEDVNIITDLSFTQYIYLKFENPSVTYSTGAIGGWVTDFYIRPTDILSGEYLFNNSAINIKNVYVNNHSLNIETPTGFRLFEEIPIKLKNIYMYDSVYPNLALPEIEQAHTYRLSCNSSYPLNYSNDVTLSQETFDNQLKIEYIQENDYIGKELKVYVLCDGYTKTCWVEEDGSTSSKVIYNSSKGGKVLLTTPTTKINLVIDPINVTINQCCSFEINNTDPYVALFYWDVKKQTLKPFVTNKEEQYNFAYPVVASIGKIPPSLQLLSNNLKMDQDDITKDYYGNRLYEIVFATPETENTLSDDVVIKNEDGFYFDEYLNDLYLKKPNFIGGGFLRQGFYATKKSNLVIPAFKHFKLKGAGKTFVNFNLDKLYLNNTLETLILEDINFGEECEVVIDTTNLKLISLKNIGCKNIILKVDQTSQSKTYLNNLTVNNLFINSNRPSNYEITPTKNFYIEIETLTVNNFEINSDKCLIKHSNIKNVKVEAGEILFTGCNISYISQCTTGTRFKGCYVKKHSDSLDKNLFPSENKFILWEMNSYDELVERYTSFNKPFHWNKETNTIDLLIDNKVFKITEEGYLTTTLSAEDIKINTDTYNRAPSAVDPETGKPVPVTAETLDEALKDIYLTKADLIKGKIPLKQLPESVAYGGLHYCGAWSFDDHEGYYPTYKDISIDLSKENFINEIQPGYFFIVAAPTKEVIKNTDDDSYNPVKDQIAIDGVTYTAGDWFIYKGAGLNGLEDFIKIEQADLISTDSKYCLSFSPETNNLSVSINDITTPDVLPTSYVISYKAEGSKIIFTDETPSEVLSELFGKNIDFKANGVVIQAVCESGLIINLDVNLSINQFEPWEKVDRAYQDAAYAILPALDPDGKEWDWRKFGEGVLDFSKVTITEAFDRINEWLFKNLPSKGNTINTIELNYPILNPTSLFKINNVNGYTPVELFLVSQNTCDYRVNIKQDKHDYKNYIYFGDFADLSIKYNGEFILNQHITLETTQINTPYGDIIFEDIHKEENSGKGIWKGFRFDFYFAPTIGDHKFEIEIQNQPDYETINVCGSKVYEWHIDAELYKNEYTNVNLLNIPLIENLSYISGVPYKVGEYTASYSFIFKNFLKNYTTNINFKDLLNIEELNSEIVNTQTNLVKSTEENFEEYYNLIYNVSLKCNPLPKEVISSKVFTLKYSNLYGETSQVLTLDNLIPQVNSFIGETERCYSGKTFENENIRYPLYNATIDCGAEFDSTIKLNEEDYQMELQKVYDASLDKAYYQEPNFTFYTQEQVNAFIYTPKDHVEYYWATFNKFNNNQEEIIFKDVSGFYLNILTTQAEEWENKYNFKTGILQDVEIYMKLVSSGAETKWLNINKAYNYYGSVENNGDGVVYMGDSTALSKRITFGPNTKSGKLLIRVGLKRGSNLKFEGIQIKTL